MEKTLRIMLWLLLIGGLLYSIIATYIRIFEKGDYIVRYNISCNPSSETCFSEDNCDESGNKCETTYYSSMQRIKSNLARVCGADISNCALAEKCTEGEVGCSIKYCNPEKDTCTNAKTNNE